jgi:hypothetical protein
MQRFCAAMSCPDATAVGAQRSGSGPAPLHDRGWRAYQVNQAHSRLGAAGLQLLDAVLVGVVIGLARAVVVGGPRPSDIRRCGQTP